MENSKRQNQQFDKTRKRLPNIPPEELALHRGKGQSDAPIKPQDLPAEVQAQFRRRQFRSSIHKRSRSLTGLEGIELYKEEEKRLMEGAGMEQEAGKGLDVDDEHMENFAKSLPNTPVVKRRSSDSAQTSKEAQDQEILKELRWHYKQYIRASKRKKDKTTGGDDTEARVLSAVQIVLDDATKSEDRNGIHANRCDSCTKSVEILERVAVENHVFHKSCFLCAICHTWLNYFNYCFVPDHDRFYCIQHYQDIENASAGLGEDIRHAMGIGPGVQQQFKFTPASADTKADSKEEKAVNRVQNSLKIMKEKISLLSKRGKKLEKKAAKVKREYLKCKGSDAEKQKLFKEWVETEQEKNTTMRREAELTFKIRETELSEKYLVLEKGLRVISEKSENTKTEYDKSTEKELLQEMLVVVEKREQLISEMDEAKHRYIQEDSDLEKERQENGVNKPDLIKDATAADKEANKVNDAVRRAPSTVKKQSQFMCPCVIL